MKTIKNIIKEGFFSTSGAGGDSMVDKIIQELGLGYWYDNYSGVVDYIPKENIHLNDDGSIDVDVTNLKSGYSLYICNMKAPKLPYKINKIISKDIVELTFVDCKNLTEVTNLPVSQDIKLYLKQCNSKGVDLSKLPKNIITQTMFRTAVSKFPSNLATKTATFVRSNSYKSYDKIYNMVFSEQEELDNTDFKTLPTSKVEDLRLIFNGNVNTINLKNIPKGLKRVSFSGDLVEDLGKLDLGCGELFIHLPYKDTHRPFKEVINNLKEFLLSTDLKGTRVVLFSEGKKRVGTINRFIEKIKKLKPELTGYVEFINKFI